MRHSAPKKIFTRGSYHSGPFSMMWTRFMHRLWASAPRQNFPQALASRVSVFTRLLLAAPSLGARIFRAAITSLASLAEGCGFTLLHASLYGLRLTCTWCAIMLSSADHAPPASASLLVTHLKTRNRCTSSKTCLTKAYSLCGWAFRTQEHLLTGHS